MAMQEGNFAFVTLLSSDAYLPGALTQVAALRDLHPVPPEPPERPFHTVCLVTPESVDVSSIKRLRRAFDHVIAVEILEQEDKANLRLLGRPDLTTVLTKLHVFRLVQYDKIIFLDADVLPIRPLSHLFGLPHEFSAVPDVGWPDIFNSGVLVLNPSNDSFDQLNKLVAANPSWDGGDQGILNEWRGDNWNKLSFTYNTTPTAAYTYAPAYKRYGHQINAIHFIGPNKPWKSIPYRTPFTSRSSSTSANPAYDYDSLVDRWFDVYDHHYSEQFSIPQYDFQPQRYTSAWDNPSVSSLPPAALPLDELKRLAIEGVNSTTAGTRPGEGTYTSLPLDGRFDLMRPKKERKEEPKQAEPQRRQHPTQLPADLHPLFNHSIDYEEVLSTPTGRQAALGEDGTRWQTLPTPGPNEVPPSPIMRHISLPTTPSGFPLPPADFYASESEQDEAGLGLVTGDNSWQHHEHRKHGHRHEPRPHRPPSPPMMSWNPAIEPPPNVTPVFNSFPTDTYYANAWDRTPNSRHADLKRTPRSSPTQVNSNGFFQPPPSSAPIPDILIKEGHYRDVMGNTNLGKQPSPDRSKIKSVFPWEEKPRAMPGRVFPDSDAPPPSLFLSPGSQTSTTVSTPEVRSTPEMKAPPARATPLSPLTSFPVSVSYSNAWDVVPSIQKFASRLVKPPAPLPPVLQPAFEELASRKERRKKSWDERTELSSRDGDDEDNADDEDDNEPVAPSATKWDDDSDGESAKRRSRRGSVVTANTLVRGQKKEYRSRGVQTDVVESRSVGIQVDTTPAPRKRGTVSKRHWTPSTHPSTMVTNTARTANAGLGVNLLQPSPSISPSGVRDPVKARVKSPHDSPTARSPREFILPPGATPNASKAVQNTSPPTRPSIRTYPSTSSTSTVVPTPSFEGPQRGYTFPPAPSAADATPTSFSPVPLHKSLSSDLAFPTQRPRHNSIAMASSTSQSSVMSQGSAQASSLGFRSPPGSVGRRVSNESSVGSPASSIGPVSPVDTAVGLMSPPVRKGTRVWDPARGVDVFKRGSEEVLAKFLKMGSWDDEQQ